MTTEAEATAEAPATEQVTNERQQVRARLKQALADHDSVSKTSGHGLNLSENSPGGNLAPPTTDQTSGEPAPEQTEAAEAEAPPQEEQKLSPREQKEQERYDRNWNKLQAEKEAFKKEQAELESFKEKAFKEIREARHKSQFSPDDYEAAAQRFEDEGRDEMAEEARKQASQMRDEYAREKAELEQHRREQAWQSNFQELVNAQPELAEDGSELNATVKKLLTEKPLLQTYPEGIQDAVAAANLMLDNQRMKSVEAERDELAAKVKQLESKLQPGAASVAPLEQGNGFNSLTREQQREYLRGKFREADDSVSRITT